MSIANAARPFEMSSASPASTRERGEIPTTGRFVFYELEQAGLARKPWLDNPCLECGSDIDRRDRPTLAVLLGEVQLPTPGSSRLRREPRPAPRALARLLRRSSRAGHRPRPSSASSGMRRTTSMRGYGSTHQQLRRAWARIVAAGQATCPRCGRRILPTEPCDLDHRDDRRGYLGASHRACNRRAGLQAMLERLGSDRAR